MTSIALLPEVLTAWVNGEMHNEGTVGLRRAVEGNGSGGKDALAGGLGKDLFIYAGASDSTSVNFDTITGFDAAADRFQLGFIPASMHAKVTIGSLSDASFDADMAGVIGTGNLGIQQAVLYTPNAGDKAGHTFLVVDMNGSAGYQAGLDLVIEMVAGTHLASFGTANFV